MDATAGGLIGMGLAAVGFNGAGLGIGLIFAKMIETVGRQPNAEGRITKFLWIGFALVEFTALLAFTVGILIMGFIPGK
jgi:F-type H+-transporting ATPase subunit c